MDEQIMSWATSRPEVSKDKITMWWVSVSLLIVNAYICVLLFPVVVGTCLCSVCICLSNWMILTLGACGFSRTGTWEVNVMSTYGVLAGMDSWPKREEM